MPCLPIRDAATTEVVGWLCRPTITARRVRILRCPTCARRRRMWAWFQEYYGWHITCLTCGDAWQDGEMCPRSFARGWRAASVAAARRMMAEARA